MKTHRMTFRCRYKYSFPIFDIICPMGQSTFWKIIQSSMEEAQENNFKSLENNNIWKYLRIDNNRSLIKIKVKLIDIFQQLVKPPTLSSPAVCANVRAVSIFWHQWM